MKKRLLLAGLLFGSFINANAQNTCATAVEITDNGTIAATAITGTYVDGCFGTGTTSGTGVAMKAKWYTYTATATGLVTVSSDISANAANADQRVSVYTGVCGTLECYNLNDDVSDTNYRSTVQFPVVSGTTYYIQWDNYWAATAFSFSFDFTETSCLSPNSVTAVANVTASSADVTFDASLGSVAGYEVEVGEAGFAPGEGTSFSTTTTTASLTGLTTADNAPLQFYVRANCGDTDGVWIGPYTLRLAAILPYSNDFDDATNRADGFSTVGGWNLSNDTAEGADIAHTPEGFLFSNVSTTADADSYIFTRPISLRANESITVDFFANYFSDDEAAFEVTVGTTTAPEDQEVIGSFTAAFGDTYEEYTSDAWTAPTSGVYYVGFHNISPAAAVASSLLVDTISITSILGTDNFSKSNFSVFPNPTSAVINISNASALINAIQVTDLNGRVVKTAKFAGTSEAQVNLSELSSGVYLMSITSDKGTTVKKVIKN